MKLVIEAEMRRGPKIQRGTVVGFVATDSCTLAVFVSGDHLLEAPLDKCKVISIEHIQATRMVSD